MKAPPQAFRAHDAQGLFNPAILPLVRETQEKYTALRKGHPVSFIAFAQAPYHHFGLASLEQSQLSPRSPFLDNDLVKTAFRAPEATLVRGDITADHDVCLRLITDGNPGLVKIRSDRGIGGRNGIIGSLTRAYFEVTFRAEYEYDSWRVNGRPSIMPAAATGAALLGRHSIIISDLVRHFQLHPGDAARLTDSRGLTSNALRLNPW